MSTKRVYEGVPVSLRLETETYEAFRQLAEANHRSMAGELRRLIEAHIAAYDSEQREAA